MTNQAALVWCPCPDKEVGKRLAARLLDERLVACANILPAIESVFEWNGRCATETEVAVLFKTTGDCLDEVVKRLGDLHPYDTPAILGWRCDAAHPATLTWLTDTLK